MVPKPDKGIAESAPVVAAAPIGTQPASETGPVTVEGDTSQSFGRARTATSGPIAADAEPLNSFPSYSTTIELGNFMSLWLRERTEALYEGDPRDYQTKREEAESGDSEAAFWLHILLSECQSIPRTDWQLERRVEQAQDQLARRYESAVLPEDAFHFVDRIQRGYEICSVLDPDLDLAAESLRWLNLAADLGHMGAQRLYHALARQLMWSGSLMFRRPGLITEFKDRADQYVKRLIDAGHPQGYSLMSRMLLIGDVYEQDYFMAYVYAHAAELVGQGPFLDEARSRMESARFQLSFDQIFEAERLAREIVRN